METEKKGRGGARVGAGRKPKSGITRSCTITCNITPKAMEALEAAAAAKGVTKNSFINDWLESLA